MGFVHLHLHSEYSLLDSACRLNDIVNRAKELGQEYVAVTDHGVMFAAVDFYNLCIENNIKPIIGCEMYVAPHSRFDKIHGVDDSPYHLVLLCENEEGYKNLIKLVSISYSEGFYIKPRIDKELLSKYHKGLIALSGCSSGEIAKNLILGDYEKAKNAALDYLGIFGKGNFFIEVQNHLTFDDVKLNNLLFKLSADTNIPAAATNDCHYIKKEDAKIQRVLVAIQTGRTLKENNPLNFPTDEYYMKSESEMLSLFKGHENAVYITEKIAERCRFEFEFGKTKYPKYDLSEKYLLKYHDNITFFKALCSAGLSKRYNNNPSDEAKKRLEYEQKVIIDMGYTDYYLIVWDFVSFAKKNDIPVGPGRGSGAGSLCAYCIGITEIDPLKYNLLFERFLNPERVSMPDFDIDFCYEGRQRVIDYVIKKYGSDRVSQIVTFGTMAAKGAVRDVTRVMGLPYQTGDTVARAIPTEPHNITIDEALKVSEELKSLYTSDKKINELINTARAIEGLPRNTSTHAAGVLISDAPVMDYVPVIIRDNVMAAQYTMTSLEKLGLLKMDFLGLRNLTIIKKAVNFIREKNPDFDINKIPTDDKETFDMFSAGKTEGVFQFESPGMKRLLTRFKPSSIEDLIAAIAIYRPGPMDSIPKYIENRKHPDKIEYKHPLLKNILDITYGCIIYQEQVMEICRTLAGYSYGRADIVRRAMAKKKHSEMEKERSVFIEGCLKNNISEEISNSIFDEMASFASYAFNKSHAAAYSYISYQTAYLKCHYFVEYMASLMTVNDFVKINDYISECNLHGIKIFPPDINESFASFVPENGGIRFSLGCIKGVGENISKQIVGEREKNGKYKSPEDFCRRNLGRDMSKKVLESLIKCGALDCLGYNRRELVMYHENLMDFVSEGRKSNIDGQIDFFGSSGNEDSGYTGFKISPLPDYSQNEKLQMEYELLGIYASGNPISEFDGFAYALKMKSLAYYMEKPEKTPVNIICIIMSHKKHITQKGMDMAFITVYDTVTKCDCIVFPKLYASVKHLIRDGKVIAIKGSVSADSDNSKKIIAEGIMDAASFTYQVKSESRNILFLRCKSTDYELIEKAAKICNTFSGRNPVVFYFYDKKKKVTSNSITGVTLTEELLEKMIEIFGADNIAIKVYNY